MTHDELQKVRNALAVATTHFAKDRNVVLDAIVILNNALAEPPQRTWVDLTRTQIQNVYFEILKEHRGGHQMQGQLAFGEALQAKIKEKNSV
jgi:hypothetical protein